MSGGISWRSLEHTKSAAHVSKGTKEEVQGATQKSFLEKTNVHHTVSRNRSCSRKLDTFNQHIFVQHMSIIFVLKTKLKAPQAHNKKMGSKNAWQKMRFAMG